MRNAIKYDRPGNSGTTACATIAAEEIQPGAVFQHERGFQPVIARAAAGLELPGGGGQDMNDFCVSVISSGRVAVLDVEENIRVQREDIGGIAQADTQSLDAHGLLAGSACVKINVSQVRIYADIVPLRITADGDGQVVIAAGAAQRGASTGVAPIEPPGSAKRGVASQLDVFAEASVAGWIISGQIHRQRGTVADDQSAIGRSRRRSEAIEFHSAGGDCEIAGEIIDVADGQGAAAEFDDACSAADFARAADGIVRARI